MILNPLDPISPEKYAFQLISMQKVTSVVQMYMQMTNVSDLTSLDTSKILSPRQEERKEKNNIKQSHHRRLIKQVK